MRLFHFSDRPDIGEFKPRPVANPSPRAAGKEWLNGPLVWAIDERHQSMYLFPRECPRVLLWATQDSTTEDRKRWLDSTSPWIAYIESRWLPRVESAWVFRYELSPNDFIDLADAGMYVAHNSQRPLACELITNLPRALRAAGTELRTLQSLVSLKQAFETSIHASGIRLRNAVDWD